MARYTWIRYQVDVSALAEDEAATAVELTPIDDAFMENLRSHPWREQPQMKTAFRLWQHGLRGGYVWIKDGQPMCLQWLLTPADNAQLATLSEWSGMYPPLPDHCGQLENILTLPAGLRYPGGAAGPFARAMYKVAAERGLKRLITHIHEANGAAQRWAQRTGWARYGVIQRYRADVPLLRHHYLHLHSVADTSDNPRFAPTTSGVRPVSGGR